MMRKSKAWILGLAALALNVTALAEVSTERLEQQARQALLLPADAAHGGVLYERNCKSCHGAQAHGDVIRLIPALAGQRRSYLVKHIAELNDAERAAAHMHPKLAADELAQPQAWADLAAHLRQAPPMQTRASSDEQFAAQGERSYRLWCASCHQTDASGDEAKFIPALRNQHRQYLLKELRTVAAPHRLSVPGDIMRVLDGLRVESTAGIADHISRLENLSASK